MLIHVKVTGTKSGIVDLKQINNKKKNEMKRMSNFQIIISIPILNPL